MAAFARRRGAWHVVIGSRAPPLARRRRRAARRRRCSRSRRRCSVWTYLHRLAAAPARRSSRCARTTPFFVVSLFSTRGGLLPVVAGGVRVARSASSHCARARRVTLALLAVFALEVYVISSAWVVTGGYGYGARRLSDGATLMALGIGLLWARREVARSPWPRRALSPVSSRCACCSTSRRWSSCAREDSVVGRLRALGRALPRRCRDASLGRVFGAIGYPFVQPAGWLFALWHRVPASTFEDVVGNWFLDRDGQWFMVQSQGHAARRERARLHPRRHGRRAAEDAGARHRADSHALADVRGRADSRCTSSAPCRAASARRPGTARPSPRTTSRAACAWSCRARRCARASTSSCSRCPSARRSIRIDFESTTQWWTR